ncbi:hypothetical protein Tco_0195229 [Tanacetum coccineum]
MIYNSRGEKHASFYLWTQWVSDEEPEAPVEALQLPRQTPPSPDYMPGPKHQPSPDYVPGPEHPPLPDYVRGPEYPEYLVPCGDEEPIEDQPLPADASPTALSPGYEEESSGDDDDDEDEEEASKDEDEEEHLAPSDSTTLPVVDTIPSAEDTKAFETDESTPQTLMLAATKALISAVAAALPLMRHLEEIHVTWAHLEKKQTRLRTYTNIAQEFLLKCDAVTTISKTAAQDLKTASDCTTQPII